MNFRELLKKHREGAATPEESALVAAEIEKYESINEYLSEGISSAVPNQADAGGCSEAAGAAKLKRSIRKKFILTAAISVAVVAAAVLTVFFVISPLMDRMYYQPLQTQNRTMDYDGDRKLFIDFSVYSELHFPGVRTSWDSADSLGFGNYDIQISQWDYFKGASEVYIFSIERGKVKNLPIDFYQYPMFDAFRNGDPFNKSEDNPDAILEEIEKLPETAEEKAYISFKDDIPIESVYELMTQHEDLRFCWVAVRSCDRSEQHYPYTGFEPTGSGPVIGKDAVDQNRYPNLEISWTPESETSAKTLQTHFESLLKYMADNGDFCKLLGASEEFYASSLSYVEANGVKSYGCVVIGHGEDVLAFRSLPEVDGIYLDNVKLSSYSK